MQSSISSTSLEPGAPKPRPRRPEWLWIAAVFTLAALSIVGAFLLRSHADARREVARRLAVLESLANMQSALEWRAIGEGELTGNVRMQVEQARRETFEHVEAMWTLEKQGEGLNRALGFGSRVSAMENLQAAFERYQSSVDSLFGQVGTNMLGMARGSRENGNPWFENLHRAILDVSAQDAVIADRAGIVANGGTGLAVMVTGLAAMLALSKLSTMRARRAQELETERTRALAESEARFRALVSNASDLIAVLEPDGRVRYASPAARDILGCDPDELIGRDFWTDTLGLARDDASSLEFDALHAPSEVSLRRDDGPRDLEVRVQDLCDHQDVCGLVVNLRDITDRKLLERKMRHQAMHDPLTDLPNRRFFNERLEAAISVRPSQTTETDARSAVLFIDLEGVNLVNDSFGHEIGDRVLIEAAQRFAACLPDGDFVARLGGDEFTALLHTTTPEHAQRIAERLIRTLEAPFTPEGQAVFIGATVGIALETVPHGVDHRDLVRHAGIATWHAKRAGTRTTLFEPRMAQDAPERLRLEADFRSALERQEFIVHYQPKVDLRSNRVVSLEALVRWQHPTRGFVSPGMFIPFAEESGLIEPLGAFVLERACRDAAAWQPAHAEPVVIAVNLSAVQFRNPDLVAEVARVLRDTGLPPAALELEITESAVLGDVEATVRTLEALKTLGVRLAIDDFGTGYSNLTHLKRFPMDVLKIDQSFVRGLGSGTGRNDTSIVEAVIGMARALEMHVVAEGVETQEQAEYLRGAGCDLGQGYFFARPVPGATITEMLEQQSRSS